MTENSHNSLVDLQSQNDTKRNRPKINLYLSNIEMLYFD